MTTWRERLNHYNPEDKSKNGLIGLIFDIQRFSVHDGPGIRTTVFLKGCPLRCLWCQNPESMSNEPEITYLLNNCIHCNKCIEVCSEGALLFTKDDKLIIDRKKCTLCGECIETCYAGALTILGRYLSVPELMAEIERDLQFYIHSGGGVTFSGGEPISQPAYLEEACRQAKARSLHTTIDTTGYLRWEKFQRILRYVDLVLFDIKHMDPHKHRQLTGVSNEIILGTLQRIASLGLPLWIRIPLIPGCNDSPENIRATALFVANLPSVQHLDILPYHRLGEPKWHQLDRTYKFHNVLPPTQEYVYELAEIARGYDISVNIGG